MKRLRTNLVFLNPKTSKILAEELKVILPLRCARCNEPFKFWIMAVEERGLHTYRLFHYYHLMRCLPCLSGLHKLCDKTFNNLMVCDCEHSEDTYLQAMRLERT